MPGVYRSEFFYECKFEKLTWLTASNSFFEPWTVVHEQYDDRLAVKQMTPIADTDGFQPTNEEHVMRNKRKLYLVYINYI